jgi:CheY-like chemotaxis protein
VLVVDDNTINPQVITSMLSKLGVVPVVCNDGQQGFNYYLEHTAVHSAPFDRIFMDCAILVIDGYRRV